MKKIYIQPSMFVGSMNSHQILASSWTQNSTNYDGTTATGPSGTLQGGEGGEDVAVKHRGFYSSYGDAGW